MCTFVYGFNYINDRRGYWDILCDISSWGNCFWIVGGDFNNVVNVEERVGVSVREAKIRDIRNCFGQCELIDMKYRGCFFIWNNK